MINNKYIFAEIDTFQVLSNSIHQQTLKFMIACNSKLLDFAQKCSICMSSIDMCILVQVISQLTLQLVYIQKYQRTLQVVFLLNISITIVRSKKRNVERCDKTLLATGHGFVFIFSIFDEKHLNRKMNYSCNVRNLQYAILILLLSFFHVWEY